MAHHNHNINILAHREERPDFRRIDITKDTFCLCVDCGANNVPPHCQQSSLTAGNCQKNRDCVANECPAGSNRAHDLDLGIRLESPGTERRFAAIAERMEYLEQELEQRQCPAATKYAPGNVTPMRQAPAKRQGWLYE